MAENPPSTAGSARRRRAVDVAARFEAKRRRSFEYVQSPNAGLIELDERPRFRSTPTPLT